MQRSIRWRVDFLKNCPYLRQTFTCSPTSTRDCRCLSRQLRTLLHCRLWRPFKGHFAALYWRRQAALCGPRSWRFKYRSSQFGCVFCDRMSFSNRTSTGLATRLAAAGFPNGVDKILVDGEPIAFLLTLRSVDLVFSMTGHWAWGSICEMQTIIDVVTTLSKV